MKNQFSKQYIFSIKKIITENDCWIKPSKDIHRPKVNIKGQNVNLSRLVCHVFHGLDLNDSNQVACHKLNCNNKYCFNPEHIYNGTNSSNARDWHSLATHCRKGHKFDEHNTGIDSRGCRFCVLCRSAMNLKHMNKG